MFAFAQKVVKSIEQSAETIISGGPADDSILESDSYFSNAKQSKDGLRILDVKDGSVASSVGLESWFDYIIGINGFEVPTNYNDQHQLVPNYEYFIKELEKSKNKSIVLEVWSAKGGVLKNVEIPISELALTEKLDDVPLKSNPNLIIQQSFAKLGLTIQWTPLVTATFVYHVLEIHPNSPAEKSGLIEQSDYIIGAQDGLLATGGEDLLGRLITSRKNSSLILYVYNHDYNVVRPVTIYPVDNWSGGGLLGCGVGYGFLHRLPPVVSNLAPGSVLFDKSESITPNNVSQEHFEQINPPIQVVQQHEVASAPLATSAAPPIHGRKKKSALVKTELLDYLQEEGEKSRERDNQGRYAPEAVPTSPPPKK